MTAPARIGKYGSEPASISVPAAIKSEVDSRTPCVGWLCDDVAGYGRGVRPVDSHGSLVVVALGDAPRR